MGLYFFLGGSKSFFDGCCWLIVVIEVLVDKILKSKKAWRMLCVVVCFVFTGALSAEEPNCGPLSETSHLISALLLLFGSSAVKNPGLALNTVAVWRTWV